MARKKKGSGKIFKSSGIFGKKKPNIKNPLKGKGKGLINKFKHSLPKTKGLVKKALKGLKGGVADAALIPYVLPMKAALRAKGITSYPRDRSDLANLFIKKVVRGSNFEVEDFERTSVKTFNFECAEGEGEGEGTSASDVVDTAQKITSITSIIKVIVDFFKGLKAKKESGQPLTPLEEQLVESAERVDDAVEQTTGDSPLDNSTVNDKLGLNNPDGSMNWGKILLYVAIGVGAILLIKKFAK